MTDLAALFGDDPVVVSGVSAITPVGHCAPITYGSLRAGLSRIQVSDDIVIRDARRKRMAVACASVVGVTDGHRRYLRQYRMAVRALAEAIEHARLDDALLDGTALDLSLHEANRPGMDDRVRTQLVAQASRALEIDDLTARTSLSTTGHAGPYAGLERAVALLASGRAERVLVGAVDGYLDELTLQWLADIGRLKTESNQKGFVPGEASAFLVVERQSSVHRRRGRALARVAAVATAHEDRDAYDKRPCLGDALTRVLQSVVEHARRDPVATVCDLNGERRRADEWGLAMARSFDDGAPPAVWHPASGVGDCGAASGALDMVLAAVAVARGDDGAGPALAWGAGDDGERGAAVFAPLQ